MNDNVVERIRHRIEHDGPITFDEFMLEALYGPAGFYASTPVGTAGHFVTSPHVHPVFSRLVGAALEELWTLLGRPTPLRIVEVGAGDGTMAREIVAGFERAGIEVSYEAVDVSPAARRALSTITPIVAETIVDLEPLDPGLVVANELLDNLPFRRVRRRGDALVEVRVGMRDGSFVEVETPTDAALEVDGIADGDERAIATGALAFVDELGRTLRRGYALLIDYASPNDPQVRGYRAQRALADVLTEPGSADVTADVDMDAVIRHARSRGFDVDGHVPQRAALRALGLDQWLRDERDEQGEQLRGGRALAAVRTWSGRSRARLLVDPAGLGRLEWLVLRTRGLASVRWAPGA